MLSSLTSPLVFIDHLLLELINRELTHPLLDQLFIFFTDFPKTSIFKFVLAPLLLAIIFYRKKTKGLALFGAALLVTSINDFVVGSLLKEIFERPRPKLAELSFEVVLRGHDYGGYAFPSSHAADAFCLATFLGLSFPQLRLPLFVLASLMAYSRVYCGNHFPLDVIGGAAIGAFFGFVAWKSLSILVARLCTSSNKDGAL